MSQTNAVDTSLEQQFEGFEANPYPDPISGGKPFTYGFGSTYDLKGLPVTLATPPITRAQGLILLSRDVHYSLLEINKDVKVPLTSYQQAAIVDLVYNIGIGNFASSTLLKDLNAKNYNAAAAQFDKWDLASGKIVAGLLRRRQAETVEFNKTD
jgi:lysozyme